MTDKEYKILAAIETQTLFGLMQRREVSHDDILQMRRDGFIMIIDMVYVLTQKGREEMRKYINKQ